MKKKKSLLALGATLLMLAGCQNIPLEDSSSKEATSDSLSLEKGELSVETSAVFYQYDVVSYRDFSARNKITGEAVTDFSLFLNDEELVDEKSRIVSFGTIEITVKANGFLDTQIKINVKKSSSFEEKLLISELPHKLTYEKGERFDSSGLGVSYSLSYRRQNRESVSELEPCSSYSIKIDGVTVENYLFDSDTQTLKYALVEANGLNGESVVASIALTQNGSDVRAKFINPNEQYVWTREAKSMRVEFKNANRQTEKAYYSPDEVNLDFNLNQFSERDASNFRQTPSLGEVPLLVVPVVLNGFEKEATEENRQKIEHAFFSESGDSIPTNSLASYYDYSSFHKLKFTGEVTPYFNPSKEGYLGYSDPYSFTLDTPESIASDALKWAKEKLNISLDDYDGDDDGYVDSVWLIYLENTDTPLTSYVNAFWPFTSASLNAPGTKENPSLNVYGWAGSSHLWGNLADKKLLEKQGADPHVLCHETGHMLGLRDYYSYSSSTSADQSYSPLGKLDMMDGNVGDHNPYSKMLLGWIKPYVVLGDCSIEIPSSQVENSFFLLPYDEKTYRQDKQGRIIVNPFDEYLVLDYYSYENLYKDTYERSGASYSFPLTKGGRLYHVDARALIYRNDKFTLPSDPDSILDSNVALYRCISNSQAGDRAESNYSSQIKDYFDEVRLISKDNRLVNGSTNTPTSESFFQSGDSFSLKDYESQFHYNGKFDNEKTFSTTFTITSLA